MKEFKYSVFTKVKSIGLTVLLVVSGISMLLIAQSSLGIRYKGILLILSLPFLSLGAIYEGSSHRNSTITIDDKKIHLYRKRAGVITDKTLRYNEILAIKLDKKRNIFNIFVKKILIITEMQKIDLDINCYDNYKALLTSIVDRVEKNKKNVIEEGVLKLL